MRGLDPGFNAGWPTYPYDIGIFNTCKQVRSHPRYYKEDYRDMEDISPRILWLDTISPILRESLYPKSPSIHFSGIQNYAFMTNLLSCY